MAYLVNITSRAGAIWCSCIVKINAENSGATLKWYLGLKKAILGLEEYPNRCPAIRTNDKLRHLVEVLHIRQGASPRHKILHKTTTLGH